MSTIETTMPAHINEHALAAAITAQGRPDRASAIAASLTMGWRAVLKLKHLPLQLVDVTMFPILMTLLFTYIFGGALAGSVQEYVQQLLPGILVITVAMISMYTALSLNTDISKGIFDRFRSLPFWRPAVLVGSLLGDMVRYTIAAIAVVLLGLALGFEPGAGVGGIMLSMALLLVFAFSLSWIWTTLGLLMDDAESVMMISQMTTFPLTFMSNVFVDPDTMPVLIRKFVNSNPVSFTATAVRGLMHGNASSTDLAYVFISCVALITIFAPLTMYLYNNKNAH